MYGIINSKSTKFNIVSKNVTQIKYTKFEFIRMHRLDTRTHIITVFMDYDA